MDHSVRVESDGYVFDADRRFEVPVIRQQVHEKLGVCSVMQHFIIKFGGKVCRPFNTALSVLTRSLKLKRAERRSQIPALCIYHIHRIFLRF